MIEMEDNVYYNKYAVRYALGTIKTLRKLDKIKTEESAKFKPEFEKYLISDEYKKLLEDLRKKEEDDEYRNDTDPQGYELYKKCLENPL